MPSPQTGVTTPNASRGLFIGAMSLLLMLVAASVTYLVTNRVSQAADIYYTVNTTAWTDDGTCDLTIGNLDCTLLEAVNLANAQDPNLVKQIDFAIPATDAGLQNPDGAPGSGDEYWSFVPTSVIDLSSWNVIVNGGSQNVFEGGSRNDKGPEIEIKASGTTGGNRVLVFSGNDNEVNGVVVNDYNMDAGVVIQGNGNTFADSYAGTDVYGENVAVGNLNTVGVRIECEARANVITRGLFSGNRRAGVVIECLDNEVAPPTENVISDSYLGPDATATKTIDGYNSGAFQDYGFYQHGGVANSVDNNVMSGNNWAFTITGPQTAANLIRGNCINGDFECRNILQASGVSPNSAGQLLHGAYNTVIGGPTNTVGEFPGNTIVDGSLNIDASGNQVAGNLIGFSSDHRTDGNSRVYIASPVTTIGGDDPSEGNVIASYHRGNGAPGYAIHVNSSETLIKHNKIGTNPGGTEAAGGQGIQMTGAINTFIENNVISGCDGTGIFGISDVNTNVINNIIGPHANGMQEIGTGPEADQIGPQTVGMLFVLSDGVYVQGNTISGNTYPGFEWAKGLGIGTNNVNNIRITENYIGTNQYGGEFQGTSNTWGVLIASSTTDWAVDHNVISGNTYNGLTTDLPDSGGVIQHNLIGLDGSGTYAIPNGNIGMKINVREGHTAYITDNTVSGNANHGIEISDASVDLVHNFVGFDLSEQNPIPNGRGAIELSGAYDCLVATNVVYSEEDDISLIESSTGNLLHSNRVIARDVGIKVDTSSSNNTIGSCTPNEENLVGDRYNEDPFIGDIGLMDEGTGNIWLGNSVMNVRTAAIFQGENTSVGGECGLVVNSVESGIQITGNNITVDAARVGTEDGMVGEFGIQVAQGATGIVIQNSEVANVGEIDTGGGDPGDPQGGDGEYLTSQTYYSFNGVSYDGTGAGGPANALWLTGSDPILVQQDDTPVTVNGNDDYMFTLVDIQVTEGPIQGPTTMFFPTSWGLNDCAAVEEFMSQNLQVPSACVTVSGPVFEANGEGQDYSYAGNNVPQGAQQETQTQPYLRFSEDGGGDPGDPQGGDGEFLASVTNYEHNGVSYDGTGAGQGSMALWIGGDEGPVFVNQNDTLIPFANGTNDFTGVLLNFTAQGGPVSGPTTVFLPAEWGITDCASMDNFINSNFPPEFASTCTAVSNGPVFSATSPESDYSYNGGAMGAQQLTQDAYLRFSEGGGGDPQGGDGEFLASVLNYENYGVVYDGSAAGYGSMALWIGEGDPVIVNQDDVAIPFANGTNDFTGVLLDFTAQGGPVSGPTTVFVPAEWGITDCAAMDNFINSNFPPEFAATCASVSNGPVFSATSPESDYSYNGGAMGAQQLTQDAYLRFSEGGGGDPQGGDGEFLASVLNYENYGVVYDGSAAGYGSMALWIGEGDPVIVNQDDVAIPFANGTNDFTGVLLDFTAQGGPVSGPTTVFVPAEWGITDCAAMDNFINSNFPPEFAATCASVSNGPVFSATSPESDYSYNGGAMGAQQLTQDAYLRFSEGGGGDPGGGDESEYLTSLTYFEYNDGVDVINYDGDAGQGPMSLWMTGDDPIIVGGDDTPISVDGNTDYMVALVDLTVGPIAGPISLYMPTDWGLSNCGDVEAFIQQAFQVAAPCAAVSDTIFFANGEGQSYSYDGGNLPQGMQQTSQGEPYIRFSDGGGGDPGDPNGGGGDITYTATMSPLSYNGVTYQDSWFEPGVPYILYLVLGEEEPFFAVNQDGVPIANVNDSTGDLNVALVTLQETNWHMTVFLDDLVQLQQQGIISGNLNDCSGTACNAVVEELFTAIFQGNLTPIVDHVEKDVLNRQENMDLTYSGSVPVASGYSDPLLTRTEFVPPPYGTAGIEILGSGVSLDNNRLYDNEVGIVFNGSSNFAGVTTPNEIFDNGTGIIVDSANDFNAFFNNIWYGNETGINLQPNSNENVLPPVIVRNENGQLVGYYTDSWDGEETVTFYEADASGTQGQDILQASSVNSGVINLPTSINSMTNIIATLTTANGSTSQFVTDVVQHCADTDKDSVCDYEDQCANVTGLAEATEYILEVLDFQTTYSGVPDGRVFLGTQEITNDSEYHDGEGTFTIPLVDEQGNMYDDGSFKDVRKQLKNAGVEGVWLVVRQPNTIISGAFGYFSASNGDYVYYKTRAQTNGGVSYGNYLKDKFEHQGDGEIEIGTLGQDEFWAEESVITAEATVRPYGDFYQIDYADLQGCPIGDLIKTDIHIVDQTKSGVCTYTSGNKEGQPKGACTLPLDGVEIKVFDREDPAFADAPFCSGKTPCKKIKKYDYDNVFEGDWDADGTPDHAGVGLVGTCTTVNGKCMVPEERPGRYFVVGKYYDADANQTAYHGRNKDFKKKIIDLFDTEVDDMDCDCDGGMKSLTVAYNGVSGVNIDVYTKKQDDLLASFTNVSTGDLLTVDSTGLSKGKLATETLFYINGEVAGNVHTSCSRDISGNIYGEFTVTGFDDNSGNICPDSGDQVSNGYPNLKLKDRIKSKDLRFMKKYLKNGVIELQRGSRHIVEGSVLTIDMLDYIVWDDNRELYPFIFTSESLNDWTIDVCMQTPQGYSVVGILDDNGDLVTSDSCVQTIVAEEEVVVVFEIEETNSPEPDMAVTIKTEHINDITGELETNTYTETIGGIRTATIASIDQARAQEDDLVATDSVIQEDEDDNSIIYIVLAAIAVVILLGGLFLLRRSKKGPKVPNQQ